MSLVVADGKRVSAKWKGGQNVVFGPGEELPLSKLEGVDLDRLERLELVVDATPKKAAAKKPPPDPKTDGGDGDPPAPDPAPLPTTKAELEKLAADLNLQVKGTGKDGAVKADDLRSAIAAHQAA